MLPALHLSSAPPIATYFLIISLACSLGAVWFVRRASARALERVTAVDLTLTTMISAFLGARLLHVVFEEAWFYQHHPLRVLQVWNGGFVFLGGAVAGILAGWLFCWWKREPFWYWADTAVVPLAFGYGMGRIACFLNGCCYGRTCDLPWAIDLHGAHRHPTQLYASFWEFAVLGVLLVVERRLRTSGYLFSLWLILHGAGRIVMEMFRDDPRGGPILGLSLGIWMSTALILLGMVSALQLSIDKGLQARS
ncbi:MAG: prolipoprotein diacylglyceryl transferase [Bdellovibrionales bacterium]